MNGILLTIKYNIHNIQGEYSGGFLLNLNYSNLLSFAIEVKNHKYLLQSRILLIFSINNIIFLM